MFDFLFGWRKASNCKRLLRRTHCRMKLLECKRTAIARQVRDDVGQLLKRGHGQTVFSRVEQLYMDEGIITVYKLLGHYCEFITINLSYIRRHKECPNDVNEAVSSLVYASARCGDVPELKAFRELFEDRYGQEFIRTALDLLPGNLVNIQIKEKLSISSVPEDAKFKLVNEIFREYCIQNGSLAVQYSQEWHLQQFQANDGNKDYTSTPNRQFLELNVQEIEKEAPMLASLASISRSEDCFYLHTKYLMDTGKSSPINLLAVESAMAQNVDEMDNSAQVSHIPSLSSCSDTSVHLPDEDLVYLDDIEEFKSPKLNDYDMADTRVFMFKSSPFANAKSGTKHKEHRNPSRRRLRISSAAKSRKLVRRSLSRESMKFEDVEYERYYTDSVWDSPAKITKPFGQQRFLTKVWGDKNEPALSLKRGRHQLQVSRDLNRHQRVDRFKMESPRSVNSNKHKPRTQRLRHHGQKQSGLVQESVSRLSDMREVLEKRMQHEDNLRSLESSTGSDSVLSTPANRSVALTFYVKDAATQCMRAFTMPAERPRDRQLEMYSRTSSLPVPNPANHVHPKLPDYDDLEAKFVALKQAHLNNQCH